MLLRLAEVFLSSGPADELFLSRGPALCIRGTRTFRLDHEITDSFGLACYTNSHSPIAGHSPINRDCGYRIVC